MQPYSVQRLQNASACNYIMIKYSLKLKNNVYLLGSMIWLLFLNCLPGRLEYSFLEGRTYIDRDKSREGLIQSKEKLNANSGKLILKLSGVSNFRIEDLNLNLSFDFPDVFMEKILCNAYPLPFLYSCEAEGHPRVRRKIEFQKKLSLQGNQIQVILDEGDYFASLENGTNSEIKLDPIENRKIFISFGYFYAERRHTLIRGAVNCVRYDKPIESVGENSFQCPKISIRKNKVIEITVKVSEREFKDFWNIIFPKFIPGLISLGPFTNVGYYMKRDYTVLLKNPE